MATNKPAYTLASHLKEQFEETARWREGLAHRFPNDDRISDAATRLRALASLCEGWKADTIIEAAYQSAGSFDEDDDLASHWTEIESELLRSVGFHFLPDTVDEYVTEFHSRWSRRISS